MKAAATAALLQLLCCMLRVRRAFQSLPQDQRLHSATQPEEVDELPPLHTGGTEDQLRSQVAEWRLSHSHRLRARLEEELWGLRGGQMIDVVTACLSEHKQDVRQAQAQHESELATQVCTSYLLPLTPCFWPLTSDLLLLTFSLATLSRRRRW